MCLILASEIIDDLDGDPRSINDRVCEMKKGLKSENLVLTFEKTRIEV